MYKGIKIIGTIFVVVFFGLLNAMEKEDAGSGVGNQLQSVSLVSSNREDHGLSKVSNGGFLGERIDKIDDKKKSIIEEEPNENLGAKIEETSTFVPTKKSRRSTSGLFVYLISRPAIWSSKAVDKLTDDLENKSMMTQILVSCSAQTAVEVINLNPTIPISLLKSAIGKCGNATSGLSLSDLFTLKGGLFAILTTGAAWVGKGMIPHVMLAAGNMYATWRVGNKVDEAREQIEQVQRQIQELDKQESVRHENTRKEIKETRGEVTKTRQELIQKLDTYKKDLTQEIEEHGNAIKKELKNEAIALVETIAVLETRLNARLDEMQTTLADHGTQLGALHTGLTSLTTKVEEGQKKSDEKQKEIISTVETMKEDHSKKFDGLTAGQEQIKKDVQGVQSSVSGIDKKVGSLEEGREKDSKLFEKHGEQLEQIAKTQKQDSELLTIMKNDLTSLKVKIDGLSDEVIVAKWQEMQQPIAEKVEKQYEELRSQVAKLDEKLDPISKVEWENASITRLLSFNEMLNDRLKTMEGRIENMEKENAALRGEVALAKKEATLAKEEMILVKEEVKLLKEQAARQQQLLLEKIQEQAEKSNQMMVQNSQMMGMMQVLLDQNKSAPVSSGDSSVNQIMKRRGLGPKFKSGSD